MRMYMNGPGFSEAPAWIRIGSVRKSIYLDKFTLFWYQRTVSSNRFKRFFDIKLRFIRWNMYRKCIGSNWDHKEKSVQPIFRFMRFRYKRSWLYIILPSYYYNLNRPIPMNHHPYLAWYLIKPLPTSRHFPLSGQGPFQK